MIFGGVIRGKNVPKANASIFGYIWAGERVGTHEPHWSQNVTMILNTTVTNEKIHDEMKKFWDVEAIGIESDIEQNMVESL